MRAGTPAGSEPTHKGPRAGTWGGPRASVEADYWPAARSWSGTNCSSMALRNIAGGNMA